MSTSKAALKAAKAALDGQNYGEAITQAKRVLENDDQNYFGHVFLGRALEKQNNFEDAANAYTKATRIKAEDELAWKGLCGSLEALGSKRVDEYIDAACGLANVYQEASDEHQCQVVIDKMVSFIKEHGSRDNYKKALGVLLPTSPFYSFLEGRLQKPSFTYSKLAEMTEIEEKETINRLIGERRTRLGAKIGQVTQDVKNEVFSKSRLEDLYQDIINWTSDDEERRQYEEKLLQRAYDQLCVLPPEDKSNKRDQVIKLAHDTVVIKNPLRLAWQLELDWKDFENVSDVDENVLLEFVEYFPDSGVAKIITGYLGFEVAGRGKNEGNTEETNGDTEPTEGEEKLIPISAEERLLLIAEGLEDARISPFAHRLVADYYLQLGEYESCIDVARTAQNLTQTESKKSGLRFEKDVDAIKTILATSLVYFQSPKNHPEAKSLFEEVLKRQPDSTPALLGIGLIFEEQELFEKAAEFLEKALTRDPDNVRIGTEAAWCKAQSGSLEQGLEQLKRYVEPMEDRKFKDQALRARTEFRIGKCMWDLSPDKASRKSRRGPYAHFITAIKLDREYAPAYTSLGIYYADYAKDKIRARQCFQKSFDLSSQEVLAAERLARTFAEAGEWDIVEVVAQRVIDSGVAKPAPGSKRKGLSWPFAAMAVVQMNRQEYPKSVVSFQAALRISPNDYHAWVGLGESYHSSGRYSAAQRALEHALTLAEESGIKSENVWFAEYMLANVHRELGDFEDAVAGYGRVLERRPDEFGVSIALLQTLVEQSWHRLQTGFFGSAAQSARKAIDEAHTMEESYRSAFNYWKAVGDACSVFTFIPGYSTDFPFRKVVDLLSEDGDSQSDFSQLANLDNISVASLHSTTTDEKVQAHYIWFSALLAYKRVLQTCSHDVHAQAVGWFNLGWAEYRTYTFLNHKDAHISLKTSKFGKAAVRCFKKSIELEAGNAEFWNALGVATTTLNPMVAQHSFVRSLKLNERNARTWTNLGVLYLTQNDNELAHDAFARSQSTDPDYANAWLGEGYIALLMGDMQEALSHFTHAFEIAEASSTAVQSQYSMTFFDQLLSTSYKSAGDVADLIQPILALRRLCGQVSDTNQYRHLLALFQERVHDYSSAVANLEAVCAEVEAKYEESEASVYLGQFAQARSDLARCFLGISKHEEASENAETALELLEEPESTLDASQRQKVRLSAQLTAGLANHYLGDMDKAIEMFRGALEESSGAADVVCLLSQVLWAKGGEEERNAAKDQLFDCIEKHDGNLGATTLLGAMSAIGGDDDTAEAVADDLRSFTVSADLGVSERLRVQALLSNLAAITQIDAPETEMSETNEALTAAYMTPWLPQGWSDLAQLDSENSYPTDMALKTSEKAVPPEGSLDAEELAKAFTETAKAGDAQKAIMLCSWMPQSWTSLGSATD